MRILHTADWQLGRVFALGDSDRDDGRNPAAALYDARFAAVEAIAGLAAAQDVDIVLVAGDVFEHQGLGDATLRRLVNAMTGYSGPWLLLPGNHDAALAESVWTRLQRLQVLPDNITLALQPGVHEYPDMQLAVLAAPLTQRHTHEDVTASFEHWPTPPGWLRVGLAHGSVTGILPATAEGANPIAADRAVQAGLDYLALGDWHGLKEIDPRTWYSGTPEPDRFVANDPGHVLLVDLDVPGAVPRVEEVAVATHTWHESSVELHGAADLDGLVAQLASLGSRDVLRLHLAGSLDVRAHDALLRELDVLRARLHLIEVRQHALRLAPTLADLDALHLDGVLADVVEDLQQLQREGDAERSSSAGDALHLLIDLVRNEGASA